MKAAQTHDEAWLSLVERRVRDAEVAGSNPVASTKKRSSKDDLFFVENTVYESATSLRHERT